MVPLGVVVRHKLADEVAQTSLSEENEPIETLFADRAHEPLRVGIGIRRLDRCLHDAYAGTFDETPESLRPFPVAGTNQSPIAHEKAAYRVGKRPRRLR